MRPRSPGFRPRRRWGQHFLVNRGAIAAIIDALDPREDDRILEIGPGRGALTRSLVGRVRWVTAVEIDPDLAPALRRELQGAMPATGLEIVQGDILELDLEALLRGMGATPGHPGRVVANLPYNIATAVILRLLAQASRLRDLLVMVQREVAERIAAAPGTKAYGSLSVLCQASARVDRVLRLQPGSFRPRPRVESDVIRLTLRGEGSAGLHSEALSTLLRIAFARRRKTLLNNLGAVLGRADAERLIRAAGLDPALRPEALPVDAFLALLRVYRTPVAPPPSRPSRGAL